MEKNISIGIIGAGNVGAGLAFALLFESTVSKILLFDIDRNKLEGEVTDLNHASWIVNNTTKFVKGSVKSTFECDKVFITAGFPRKPNESNSDLYYRNRPVIASLTNRYGAGHYLVTNPVEMLAEEYGHSPVGLHLDEIRERTDAKTGDYILKLKGYTNWGIIAECLKIIKGE